MSEPAPRSGLPYLLAVLSLLALVLVSFGPEGRTWGFDAWAELAVIVRVALLLAAVAVGGLVIRVASRDSRAGAGGSGLLGDVALVSAFGLLWVLLRTQAHYLGDGWQSLSLLAADPPRVKATAPLVAWLLPGLRGVFGPDPSAAALAAYRVLSITSGVLAAVALVVSMRALVPARFPRYVVVLGVLLGGASLVFFGYVENYAPLVAATTAFAGFGAAAAGGDRRFLVPAVLAAGLAAASHVLGLALLPALAYLLLRRTPVGRPVFAFAAIVAIGAGGAFIVLRDLSLRLRFVPWVAGEFTQEGYTLASVPHVTDLVNLLFVLVPGGLMLIGVALAARDRCVLGDPALRFLGVLAGSALAAVALLDPKLGMARDQDLFAFAGPPLAMLLLLAWARVSARRPALRPFGPIAVLLAALVLLPRVWTLRDDDRAIEPFRRALALDHAKSRNAYKILIDRWRRLGREDLAQEEALRWSAAYPERQAVLEARAAEAAGDYQRAALLNEKAIAINPQYMDAYNNIGAVLILVGMDAEALQALEVAYALAPDEPGVLANLGTVLFRMGDVDRAEKLFLRLYELDPRGYGPRRNLARTAQARGDTESYRRWIAAAAAEQDAPPQILLEYGDVLLRDDRRAEALPYLRRAIEGGVDEGTARALREALPELADPR